MQVSRGILKAAGGGIVKSATVMTTSPDFDTAMDELLKSGLNLDVGFHANLTWGSPVLDPLKVRTLVNGEGRFLGSARFLMKCFFGGISADEVRRELDAQIAKLIKRAGRISHVDGHHHVHAFPIVCNVVAKMASDLNIPYVRSPHEGAWSKANNSVLRRMTVSSLRASRPSYWRERGFATSDHFGGFALGAGNKIKERWLETIARMKIGVTEIMVHPGFCSPGNDKYNSGREEEVKILMEPELGEAIKKADIEIAAIRNLF